jgi:hypothetical protein
LSCSCSRTVTSEPTKRSLIRCRMVGTSDSTARPPCACYSCCGGACELAARSCSCCWGITTVGRTPNRPPCPLVGFIAGRWGCREALIQRLWMVQPPTSTVQVGAIGF